MYCGEEKRKAKGKASRKKGEEGRRKGKGEDKGEIALQIINNTKAVISFSKTPLSAYAKLLHSACKAEGETRSWRHSSLNFAATSTRKASRPPSCGAALPNTPLSICFPLASHRYQDHLHATLYKAVSQVTWNNIGSAEYKHIAAYHLIKHRCGSCEGLVT